MDKMEKPQQQQTKKKNRFNMLEPPLHNRAVMAVAREYAAMRKRGEVPLSTSKAWENEQISGMLVGTVAGCAMLMTRVPSLLIHGVDLRQGLKLTIYVQVAMWAATPRDDMMVLSMMSEPNDVSKHLRAVYQEAALETYNTPYVKMTEYVAEQRRKTGTFVPFWATLLKDFDADISWSHRYQMILFEATLPVVPTIGRVVNDPESGVEAHVLKAEVAQQRQAAGLPPLPPDDDSWKSAIHSRRRDLRSIVKYLTGGESSSRHILTASSGGSWTSQDLDGSAGTYSSSSSSSSSSSPDADFDLSDYFGSSSDSAPPTQDDIAHEDDDGSHRFRVGYGGDTGHEEEEEEPEEEEEEPEEEEDEEDDDDEEEEELDQYGVPIAAPLSSTSMRDVPSYERRRLERLKRRQALERHDRRARRPRDTP